MALRRKQNSVGDFPCMNILVQQEGKIFLKKPEAHLLCIEIEVKTMEFFGVELLHITQ